MLDLILKWQNLRRAWLQTWRNKAAPGVDEVTLTRWARHWETNLSRLGDMARAGTYHPNRPRRFFISKPGGGQREISILTITDRVFQRAALNVLEPCFEKMFLPCSFGYRPKRSVAKAVSAVLLGRANGLRHVLDADIRQCFDNLDHALILQLAQLVIKDERVLSLARAWLQAQSRRASAPGAGIALGAPLSPLWCNVVLHQLDAALAQNPHTQLARYADDFVILAKDEDAARQALLQTTAVLDQLKLSLHPDKTRLTSFDEGFDFLGVHFEGDEYSYASGGKNIRVKTANARMLRVCPPNAYASRW